MVKSQTQTFLAFVMIGILLIGFVGVYYVDAYYESNGESVNLFTTDSSIDFANYEYVNAPEPYYDSYRPCHRVHPSSNIYWQFNVTPIYLGNNTWVMTMNDTTTGNNHQGILPIDMPNLKNWIITDITINMSETDDTLYGYIVRFLSSPTPAWDYENDMQTIILSTTGTGGNDWANRTIDIPLNTALNIQNVASQNDYNIFEIIISDNGEGWESWSWKFSITINGYQIETTSLIDQISIVIGISVCLNVIAIVYLTDEIDLGGYTKTIKKVKK